ncbi:transposase domain-containing protein [Streptomyces sp. NPDC091280]|uniref:transposase domain-containing protein n=1 Tax=Streptomyces sp. NPDC091280 TaxID=3365984 RepID=UPI00381393C9
MAVLPGASYLEVMRHLVEGLRGQGLLGEWHIPAKSSLLRARQRLGSEPLRVLFATTAKPMGTKATPGCLWRGLRLLAVDGTLGRCQQHGQRDRLRSSGKKPRPREANGGLRTTAGVHLQSSGAHGQRGDTAPPSRLRRRCPRRTPPARTCGRRTLP